MDKDPTQGDLKPEAVAPKFESAWRERFDRFAARGGSSAKISGWSEHGLERRLQEINRALDRWPLPAATRVLDLGCGSGVYCLHLRERDLKPVGADFSIGMLGRAKAVLEAVEGPAAVPLVSADVSRLPFREESFGGLINVGVLQHIEDGAVALREMIRVLEPGGRGFVITLNRNSLHGLASHLIATLRAWRRGEWKAQKHAIRRRPADLARVARKAGAPPFVIRGVYVFPGPLRFLEKLLTKLDGLRWPILGTPIVLPFANAFLIGFARERGS